MKKLFLSLLIVLFTAWIFAQQPQKMSYQAVVRNNNNILVTNHTVGIRISILQGSSSGTPVYIETHASSTNANGLVSIRTAGAGSNGIGAGKTNTLAMLAMQYTLTPTASSLSTLSAAVAASKYSASDAQGVQYGDWYLPSSNEMILATQSGVVPNLASYYWPSTEASDNPNYASAVYGGSITVQGKDGAFNVRAIRAF